MIKLQDILTEAETFKAKSKETGKTVVYKSKENMEKAVKDGRAEPLDAKQAKPGEKEKVKGADLFKSKETDKIERPKIDTDKVFQKGRREKRTTDVPLKQAPKSVALKKGLPSDLKQSMAKISSQDDLKKVFPNAELIQDTKETHQFFKLGMESEGRGGKKYPIYAKAYINRDTGEIKMSNVYSGKRRDFGGGFTQGSDDIHGRDAESVLKDKPKAEPKSKYGAKQKGIGAGEKNLKGPQSDAGAIGGSAKAEQKVLKQLRAIGPKDNVDLCTVTVPGTNMFCAGNKGIPRAEMPQLKSTVVPGGKADKLVKAGKLDADPKTGEVNTEGMFKAMLEKEGISMSEPEPVLVSKLKATQNQLEGSKVNMFAKVLAGEQPFPDKKLPPKALKKWQDALREPIIVSEGGYILDGHHRWAALVQHDVANGGGGDIEMDVKKVSMEAQELVDKTNKFTTDMGLAVKVKKPKKENFESRMLSKINEISIKINEQNTALVEPDGTIKGGPKKDDEEIKEAGFKNLSPFEHKLRLALKGEEKQKDFPIKVLHVIQLVKVLGRGKLKSSEEKIYKQILKKYKLKEGKLNEAGFGVEYKEKSSDKKWKKTSLSMTNKKALEKNAKLLQKQEGWSEIRITNEGKLTEAKYNFIKMYPNSTDLERDIVAWYRSLKKDIGEKYAKEMRADLVKVLMKEGKLNEADTKKFEKELEKLVSKYVKDGQKLDKEEERKYFVAIKQAVKLFPFSKFRQLRGESKVNEASVPTKFDKAVFSVPPHKMTRDWVLKVAKKFGVEPKYAIAWVNKVGRLNIAESNINLDTDKLGIVENLSNKQMMDLIKKLKMRQDRPMLTWKSPKDGVHVMIVQSGMVKAIFPHKGDSNEAKIALKILKVKSLKVVGEGKLTEAKFYISSKKGLLKSSGSNWKKPQIFNNYKDAEQYISGEKAYWVSDDKGNKVNKYGEIDEGKLNEFEGKPIPMDTPNEFAYLTFKKWAYKHRRQYKKDMLKHKGDSSKMFKTASAWWYKWAYHNNKAYTHIKDSKKFGRALIVMMVDDDLIFSKKEWKKDNRITHLK